MLITSAQIIRESLSLYRKQWKVLFIYVILFVVVPLGFIIGAGIVIGLLERFLEISRLFQVILLLAAGLFSLVLTMWVYVAMATAVHHLIAGQVPPSARRLLTEAKPLLWPMIYTNAAVLFLILLGTILFIIPGFMFLGWYFFTSLCVIFDKERGLKPLASSKNLVIGRWFMLAWRVVAPVTFFAVVVNLLQWLILIPLIYFARLSTWSPEAIDGIKDLVSTIFYLLLLPLNTVAIVLLYFSAKATPTTPSHLTPPAAL